MNVAENDVGEIQAVRAAETHSLRPLRDRFVVLSERLEHDAEIGGGYLLAGIDLRPKLVDLAGLFQIAGNEMIVVGLNIELLPLTDSRTKLVSFAGIFRGEGFFAEVVIGGAQRGIGHCKIRIQLDGALEQRYSSGVVGFAEHVSSTQTV